MTNPNSSVLIVDDEPNVARAYALALDDDYDVDIATSGAEAFDVLDEEVDVVLLDRRMPGMDGDEVLQGIRTDGYDCRVAMITAVDPAFDIVDLPFDAYLTKPVDDTALQATVEHLRTLDEQAEAVAREFQIKETLVTLENEMSPAELARSDDYAEIKAKLEKLDAPPSSDHEAFRASLSE
jgi:DNA-binding response OmpR family regulator